MDLFADSFDTPSAASPGLMVFALFYFVSWRLSFSLVFSRLCCHAIQGFFPLLQIAFAETSKLFMVLSVGFYLFLS